jgi:hypothetical protein
MNVDPFEKERRRKKKKLLVVGALAGVLAIGGLGARWFFDAERLIANDRPMLETAKKRYCAILDDVKRGTSKSETPPGETVQHLGTFMWGSTEYSRFDPAGNMDAIDTTELEWLCKGPGGRVTSEPIHSVLGDLYETNGRLRGGYQYGATKQALAALRRVKYLVVVDLQQYVQSLATGSDTMNAGSYKAKVFLYRTADGRHIDSFPIDASAPGMAFLSGTRTATGVVTKNEDSQLAAQTAIAFEDTIARSFATRGISVKMH